MHQTHLREEESPGYGSLQDSGGEQEAQGKPKPSTAYTV